VVTGFFRASENRIPGRDTILYCIEDDLLLLSPVFRTGTADIIAEPALDAGSGPLPMIGTAGDSLVDRLTDTNPAFEAL